MNLCEDIIKAAGRVGIDPFTQSFKPCELGLKAGDYGSFSDWCALDETKSAKYGAEKTKS